jgi:NTP pyrophosphatase (non-canonical NTP hydrolase)
MSREGLLPAERERLALLLEEMGESLQIVGKILRHGYESSNPLLELSEINRKKLESELGDVLYAICFMISNGDINKEDLLEGFTGKSKRVLDWLHCTHGWYPIKAELLISESSSKELIRR